MAIEGSPRSPSRRDTLVRPSGTTWNISGASRGQGATGRSTQDPDTTSTVQDVEVKYLDRDGARIAYEVFGAAPSTLS